MKDVISNICSMARNFYKDGSKSIIQLFQESGYLDLTEHVTNEKLMEYLATHPDLVHDWEIYSSGKRYSPAWYFMQFESDWVVGYSSTPSQERKQVYSSGVEACAEFILHELWELTELVSHD